MFNLGVSRKPIAERSEFQRQYTGNWVWRAVAALIEDEGEYPVSYFAEKLSAPMLEIEKALSGLEELGIIRRTNIGYKKVLKFIYFSDRNLDAQKLLSDHILISTQVLARLASTENSKIFYRTAFVGTTEKKFKELCLKIENILKEFLMESSQTPPEKVYAFSLSSVDLTKDDQSN